MNVTTNISKITKATDRFACVYIWAAVLLEREGSGGQKSSQTSLLCFVVFSEYACSPKCAKLGNAKAD